MEELSGHEIAVVGAAGRFPGAKTVAALWDNLIAGRSSLGPSENEAASTPIPRGTGHWVNTNALLAEFDHFDAPFFGVPPGEAQLLDPQNRLFLECCWEALEDAAAARTSAGSNTGVFGSSGFSLYASQNFSGRDKLLEVFPTLLSVDKDYLTTRVAHLLQLRGPAITIQSACSSSLVAVHLACRSLQAGDCDAALAGGVSLDFGHRDDHQFFMPGGMLSPDGRCRPFNADSNGTVFSEGVCVVFLMRLEDAVKQRKHIYSVILGSAVNNDGEPGIGFTAPSSRGQADVLARAMAIAGINPSQVGFVEAHGTGTVLGDAIELAGLADAFGAGAAPDSCVLGSLKSNIGHLATAAGVASLVKASLVVKTGRIPPTAHFRVPNQDLSLSPFLVNPETIEWPFVGPRRAGVSSFGVGGTNAHVVLQEPPTILTSQPSRRCYPIIVSAKSESSARKMVERAAADLEMIPNGEFANAAYTMALGRSEFELASPCRRSGRECQGAARFHGRATSEDLFHVSRTRIAATQHGPRALRARAIVQSRGGQGL